ncbi:MAG: hypothetical protein AUK28_10035 [Desulfobacterales bacterium CG2_30_60_27]|nr:MAG: hypothetical protein AUK28_10035 [Desulfobacterales bacterium CG2_30_60_27]
MKTSSTKGLALAFVFITSIIVLLWIVSLVSMEKSAKAIANVLAISQFVRQAKEGTLNLALAGQLPRDIQASAGDLAPLREKMNTLREAFAVIKDQISQRSLGSEAEQRLVADFLRTGEEYYLALARFFPIKEQLAVFATVYKGENSTLADVLSERELDHVRYVRALRRSVERKTLLVGTLDYRDCGFYQWYTDHLPQDEDIAAIIRDEMDPLHQHLHTIAARVAALLADRQYDRAHVMLGQADDEQVRLGNYFSGLRSLAREKQDAVQHEFSRQLEAQRDIYAEAVQAANLLEAHLLGDDLGPALADLTGTTSKNRVLVWVLSLLGTIMSILVAWFTSRKVRSRTRKLEELTATLQQTQDAIVKNRNELQSAFDAVSLLIQEVAHDQQFDIRFANPHLVKCYEIMDCHHELCVCFGKEPMRCWQMVGTFCGGEVQNTFVKKVERCMACKVFHQATVGADPLFLIGEYFNNMMAMLEAKNREVEELSVTDPLTGLYNRRGFLNMGARQLGLSQRNTGELLLLYADLDNMKWINDTLGHDMGDLALKETVDLLRQSFRQTDIIGRLGGDEFAVLFLCEAADQRECEQVILERLRQNIEACNRKTGRCYEISISIGVSWFDRESPVPIEKLLSEADRLMYEEKNRKKANTH